MTAPITFTKQDENDFRILIDHIATGGNKALLTFDDWQAYILRRKSLRNSEFVNWYLRKLEKEWKPDSPPSSLCALLREYVEDYFWERNGPWANTWSHILRVAGLSSHIAEKSGLDPELAYLTALFHDIGKLDENRKRVPHANLGADRAMLILKGELSTKKITTITNAIHCHPDKPPAGWKIACVLYDADKLDKIGAAGLLRRVSREEDLEDACEMIDRVIDLSLDFPNLCMDASKKLRKKKRNFMKRITPLVDSICE